MNPVWSKLDDELKRCEQSVADNAGRLGAVSAEVSKWSVGEHLDHLLKATDRNLRAVRLIESNEDDRLSDAPIGRGAEGLFERGIIPRGIAQSPEDVLPDPSPSVDSLNHKLSAIAAMASSLSRSDEHWASRTRKLDHPTLGPLSALEWIQFAGIHDQHHLDIVDDIVSRSNEGAAQ